MQHRETDLPRRGPGSIVPEVEIIKIIGFLMVIACHFWAINTGPYLLGAAANSTAGVHSFGAGLQTSLTSYFPKFSDHVALYTAYHIFLKDGYQGVGLFFIISGFGLTLSFLRKPRVELGAYLAARLERIYLPYLLIGVGVNLLLGIINWHYCTLNLHDLLLLNSVGFSWFLAPLIQFYILFPVLFLAVRARKITVNTLMAGTLLGSFIWSVAVLFAGYNINHKLLQLSGCPPFGIVFFRISEPVYGMWLAFMFSNNLPLIKRWLSPSLFPAYLALYVVGCVLGLADSNLHIRGCVVPLGQSCSYFITSVSLFNLLFIVSRSILPKLSGITWMARYSYEFYLFQSVSLLLLQKMYLHTAPNAWNIPIILVLVEMFNLAGAIATHHVVEITLRNTYYRAKTWFDSLNQLAALESERKSPSSAPEPVMR